FPPGVNITAALFPANTVVDINWRIRELPGSPA
ncbi:unnamed protein product, partial [marine sediment metagenome]